MLSCRPAAFRWGNMTGLMESRWKYGGPWWCIALLSWSNNNINEFTINVLIQIFISFRWMKVSFINIINGFTDVLILLLEFVFYFIEWILFSMLNQIDASYEAAINGPLGITDFGSGSGLHSLWRPLLKVPAIKLTYRPKPWFRKGHSNIDETKTD